ncbi:semialdehyde dehydrogenase [Pedobacter yulinensis]|uniref:Semialdehyde dehydrogenase n=1 Tax=Pedobacter yulinensis TaxID=2126353 RepID=A0A2T3HLV0_9SPHI|nr:NAD(P)H-binding protein [Pedobacter yulinensis]PST83415.1 semialdehyde dehydrogenase [Pedobacter yulinensis]
MKALVTGATGATGKDLVKKLLADNAFSEVHIFVRRPAGLQHNKLTVHVVDFDRSDTWKHLVTGDVAFSCLGTTLRAAGSKEAQWKIDHDYQYSFASAARTNGVPNYILVSAAGANPASFIFYSKMKGQLEQKIEKLAFDKTVLFQPGPLLRDNSDRAAEQFGVAVIRFCNRLGLLQSHKPLPTETLAAAMANAARTAKPGVQRLSTKQIFALAY